MPGEGADDRVSRADFERLEARLRAVEAAVRPAPTMRCASCARVVPLGRFCAACGAPQGIAAPPAPPSVAPPPRPMPVAAAPTVPAPAPVAAARPPVESILGQRWAPRLGAVLVFLGVVFFLGVAIQRGWIGPIAQLVLATLAGAALLVAGAVLTARRGYGTYPQVLEGTGVCVLYVTAFVAHALPYYERETRLTELGSGVLMALVAVGAVALALVRDARVIAGLGFGLAFLTALVGADALPSLTLPYVALLGTALALLVGKKGWTMEGALGSLATGGLLLWLSFRAAATGTPPPEVVALVALVPAAAFLWLAARPASRDETDAALGGLLTLGTFAWASTVTLAIRDETNVRGVLLLAWSIVALAHAVLSARVKAPRLTVVAAGIAAVALWVFGTPLAWDGWDEAALLVSGTYALAALALAVVAAQSGARGVWYGALALAVAASLSTLAQNALHAPWEPSRDAVGPWQAWVTLALVGAALGPLLLARDAPAVIRRSSFWLAAAFGVVWTFAVFTAPFLTTVSLLVVVAALVAAALATERDSALVASATATALVVLGIAGAKVALLDPNVQGVRLDPAPAALQAVLVAATMLALHRISQARRLAPEGASRAVEGLLVGASAAVLASWILEYTEQAWPSVLLGLLGAAYLAIGLLRRQLAVHRYTGFAMLGFVLLRVFAVDLQDADLAVRAIVFVALGTLLLGIGYAYARLSRKESEKRKNEL